MAETFWDWFTPLQWYWKTLVLIFFWWLIIPLYAWTQSDWPSPIKWTVTVVSVALFVSIAAAQTGPPPTSQDSTPVKQEPAKTTPKKKSPKATPEITYEALEVTESVAFTEERFQDPNLEKGKSEVRQEGVNGVKVFVYKIQLRDGVEATRTLEKEFVSISAAPKIIADGTKEPPPTPPPPPPPAATQPAAPSGGQTVYGTNTGARYHQDHGHVGGCHSYLRSSKIPMTISEAQARGLTPCQCGSCSW